MPVPFTNSLGETRMIDTLEDLKAKGVFISSIRRKMYGGSNSEEVLCVNLEERVKIRYSQEAYGDRNYYTAQIYWQEIYTFTGQETPGRAMVADGLSPEHTSQFQKELNEHYRRQYDWHGFIVGCIVFSTYFSIGD